jgi:hypothetical protein
MTDDSRVYAFGWNISGQCGVGSDEETIKVPTEVSKLRGEIIVSIASGAMHSHFVTSDRRFYSVGSNAFGQLGNNSFDKATKPITINLPYPNEKVRLLACGDFFTILVLGENLAYAWGRNNHCQTGALRSNCTRKPEVCIALNRRCENVVYIACGSDHTAVLDVAGDVSMFGSNQCKQFGQHLTSERTPALTKISLPGERVVHLAASGNVTAAFTSSGSLHMWGARHSLHNGSRSGLAEHPIEVWRCEEKAARVLRMGRNHLHLLTRSGVLYTWVFSSLKKTPSPFLGKTYRLYYEQQAKMQVSTSSPGRSSHPVIFSAASPRSIQEQEEDKELAFEDSEDAQQEAVDDVRPLWLDGSETEDIEQADADHEVVMAEEENSGLASEHSEDDEEAQRGETTNTQDSSAEPPRRVKLPPTPWVSYRLGNNSVKDIACGAFTTHFVLYDSSFAVEFSAMALHPEQHFANKDITLSDGTVRKVHSFILSVRCPSLLSRKTAKRILLQANPSLVSLLLKQIYYSYCRLSDLTDNEVVELRNLTQQLKYKDPEFQANLNAEIAFRSHEATSIEISRGCIDASISQFKRQMKAIYETKRNTDFFIFADGPSEPEAYTRSSISIDLSADLEKAEGGLVAPSIAVHKAIVSCRCPFFEALFRSNFSESFSGSTTLNCSIDILDQFLRYIYYDFTDFTLAAATWILQNSSLLFVDKPRVYLREACTSILRRFGRTVELRKISAVIYSDVDTYEEGRELPVFVERSSSSFSANRSLERPSLTSATDSVEMVEVPADPPKRNRRKKKKTAAVVEKDVSVHPEPERDPTSPDNMV